jgi:hypothetical protein
VAIKIEKADNQRSKVGRPGKKTAREETDEESVMVVVNQDGASKKKRQN